MFYRIYDKSMKNLKLFIIMYFHKIFYSPNNIDIISSYVYILNQILINSILDSLITRELFLHIQVLAIVMPVSHQR